jgi:hypothetical protein
LREAMQRLSEIAVNASIRIFAPARADASHSMPCPAVAEGMKVVAGLSGEIAPATGQQRTRFRFGPPDRGLRPPGDDPDVDSPVIVLSAPVDEPVPTAVDWTAGIEALQARFPDRPIYLYTEADRLIPAERMQ